MKRQSALLSALAVVVIGGGAWWFSTQYHPAAKTTTPANRNVNAVQTLPTKITYQGEDGKNALELLTAKHQVVETDGFVNSIDGRANTKVFYWFLYVNGKLAEVGAKDAVTKSSDSLEWKYEEFKE
ncbi:MAG: DUF4430 domain-containing protein [Candidatus Kerfeldbacteria bacterium]|nr:DUF4430 domain-containing protein [Candidatus Kerfeldbacteria bacterium]